MHSKPFFLIPLHLASTWAQASSSCLDPNASGAVNKEICCSGSGNGQGKVGSVLYEYTCNSYANNYGPGPLAAASAHACAKLCTDDATCHASSWQASTGGGGGDCWLSSSPFTLTPDPYKMWVVLVNTQRAGHVIDPDPEVIPPETNCDEELEKHRGECSSEKNDLLEKCTSEKNELLGKCTSEKDDLSKKCTSEKDDLAKKCTSEKDDLINKCTSEKDDLTKKCSSEKNDLVKKLEACQSDLKKESDVAKKCAGDLATCQKEQSENDADKDPSMCPRDNNKIRNYQGVEFHIFCDHHHVPRAYSHVKVDTLDDCVKMCRREAKCIGGDWRPNGARTCNLKDNHYGTGIGLIKPEVGAQSFYKVGV